MKKYNSILVLSALLLQLSACITLPTENDNKRIAADISRAEAAGAYRCAPQELSLAQSEMEFFETDLAQVRFFTAAEHFEKSKIYSQLAVEKSKNCPKAILPSHKGKDQDQDGIIDERDLCPTQAEDFDLFLDQDGCPDTDNDQDGILDQQDKCPNMPEDQDKFEDQDGCPDADNDQDGIPDHEDSCPEAAGAIDKNGCPVHDKDGDSIEDLLDKCPDLAEDFNGIADKDGCPDSDIDGDGIPDISDKCPENAEDQDDFEDQDGCPDTDNDKDGLRDISDLCPNKSGSIEAKGCPDIDTDGIADIDDKCPDLAGKAQTGAYAHLNGCPLTDSDHDGIWDSSDKCPHELGVAQLDKPEQHGCPKKYKKIVITEDRIEIQEKIHFSSGKSRILKDSFELLAEIADAIRSSNLSHIEIQGHTDSKGSSRYNLKLSKRRARAVLEHLVKVEDIEKDLLEAKGLGEEQPIESNQSKHGRAQNRRVEFHLERQ